MELTGKTRLYAMLAHPADHVRAPVFFNPGFEKLGIDAFLVVFHVHPDDIEDTVPRLQNIRNLKGLILTIPHKPAVARMCHELGPNARQIGTVNALALAQHGASALTIANRTVSTAEDLAARVRDLVAGCHVTVGDTDPAGHDVVVNATSLGLRDDDQLPFDPARLDPATAVIDIVVPRTRLQELVETRGNKMIGGRPMVDTQIESQLTFLGELPRPTD